jgi:hypothetical protein
VRGRTAAKQRFTTGIKSRGSLACFSTTHAALSVGAISKERVAAQKIIAYYCSLISAHSVP